MHPQAFLQTLWRMELRPQVFVAMSFEDRYQSRFDEVLAPAIRGITINEKQLEPYRVDLSKSGDSILSEIVDGIAHAELVLADVSTVGKDSVTGRPYRNGNVMYEVGIALACRQPAEVLLVRDDRDPFLFDVSTVPHMHIDFAEKESASAALQQALRTRLRERDLTKDVRVQKAVASLSIEETNELRYAADLPPDGVWTKKDTGVIDFHAMEAIPRLLDKGVIRVVGMAQWGFPAYALTPLGRVVAGVVKTSLRSVRFEVPPAQVDKLSEKPETTDGS